MKKALFLTVVICLSLGIFAISGCAKKAASSNEAIQNAESLATVQEKANYLVQQAEAFYNSKEFQQAIQTAQYVLSNLDKDSQPAKNLIEKAKAQLEAIAKKTMGDASKKLFGN